MVCRCPNCGFERPCSALAAEESAKARTQRSRDLETIGAGFELAERLMEDCLFDALDRALMILASEVDEEERTGGSQ